MALAVWEMETGAALRDSNSQSLDPPNPLISIPMETGKIRTPNIECREKLESRSPKSEVASPNPTAPNDRGFLSD